MKMIDVGHEYPSMQMDAPEESKKPRMDYPTIYLRGKQIPMDEMPEGKFCVVCEVRVAGMRNPTDGEKSMDLEVCRMSTPIPKEELPAMESEEGDSYEDDFSPETRTKAFHESLQKAMIGQSG